ERRAGGVERRQDVAPERAREMESEAPSSSRSEKRRDVGDGVIGNGKREHVSFERSAAGEIERRRGELGREFAGRVRVAAREQDPAADGGPGPRERAPRPPGP